MATFDDGIPRLKSNKETDAAVARQNKGGVGAVLLSAFDTHTMAQNEVGKDYQGSSWRVKSGEKMYSKDPGFYSHSKVIGSKADSFYKNVMKFPK